MTATATPTTASRATAAPAAPDFSAERAEMQKELQQLRNKVRDIDNISQAAFSQISALAQLSLGALKDPNTYKYQHSFESLARTLEVIWNTSDSAENNINAEAEDVGCNYVDEDWTARSDARVKARESAAS